MSAYSIFRLSFVGLIACFLFVSKSWASKGNILECHFQQQFELPVEPSAKQKKARFFKRVKKPLRNVQRSWGVFSLVAGAYCILFLPLSLIVLIGAMGVLWYTYLMVFSVAAIGVMLVISGVSNIDRSYIIYSSDLELKIDRLIPIMRRDFAFGSILLAFMVFLLLIHFFATAALLFLVVAALFTAGFLKKGQIKRWEKELFQ